MLEKSGFSVGCVLDGKGGGRTIDLEEIRHWTPEQGLLWVDLDITHSKSREWLKNESSLDYITTSNLSAGETRPRTLISQQGILQILRGINHAPGSEPEDMVAIRMWIDKQRIITARRRFVLSVRDIFSLLESGLGPKTTSEFLIVLNDSLTLHISESIDELDEEVDELETDILTVPTHQLRPKVADIRRRAISMRRYLAPQREALYRLYMEECPFLSQNERIIMREVTDRVVRYVEDLDTARERASILQEELSSSMAEQLNKKMLVLSTVAVIFMPITFLSGLMGANVKGIPGANNPWGFSILCIVIVAVTLFTLSTFRYKKWI